MATDPALSGLGRSMMGTANANTLSADVQGLGKLNTLAGKDQRAAIRESARQFEALFMNELLKSMREASFKSGLLDSEESNLANDLLDQQWATQMTGMPRGLSEMIERQLTQQLDAAMQRGLEQSSSSGSAPVAGAGTAVQPSAAQTQFVAQHRQAALAVSRESGIPAGFMIGQAAHETGWGRSEIRGADGSNSHNLFGIKATGNWQGKVAEVTTTEYIDGVPRKVTARFRAYDSYADAFRDYARLIGNSPRYSQVMENLHSSQAFAQQLQRAGYATDPQYASKLSRVINTALNVQRALS